MSATELSAEERAVVERFEDAPPAPESFDASAALRRVLALADHLEEKAKAVCATSSHACSAYSNSADWIRAAVESS